MSRELSDLALTSVLGGLQLTLSAKNSPLVSSMGGEQKERQAEEGPVLSDLQDLLK